MFNVHFSFLETVPQSPFWGRAYSACPHTLPSVSPHADTSGYASVHIVLGSENVLMITTLSCLEQH